MVFETSFYVGQGLPCFCSLPWVVLAVFLRFAQVRGLADQRWYRSSTKYTRQVPGVKRNFRLAKFLTSRHVRMHSRVHIKCAEKT